MTDGHKSIRENLTKVTFGLILIAIAVLLGAGLFWGLHKASDAVTADRELRHGSMEHGWNPSLSKLKEADRVRLIKEEPVRRYYFRVSGVLVPR